MNWNPFRKKKQLELADDREMQKLDAEAEEFYSNILEEGDAPAFVSDEATVFDISSSSPDYLSERCSAHYGQTITMSDLKLPFHLLLSKLNGSRNKQMQVNTNK